MVAKQLRRAWAAPLWAHLVVLAIVLVLGAAFVGTGASFTEDEGAAIVQAKALADDGRWTVPPPYPNVDAAGEFYPYVLSQRGEEGISPFVKHPLYALTLAALWRVAGVNGIIGLSMIGTLGAAWAAAMLARRIDPVLARGAVWVVGLGSPLLVDSYLAVAHTVGAALAGALAVVLFTSDAESRRRNLGRGLAAVVLAVLLVLMRTEGVLFVGVAGGVALLARRPRWVGVAAASSGAIAYRGEGVWIDTILGAVRSTTVPDGVPIGRGLGGGGLAGRVEGAFTTLLRPGGPGVDGAAVLLAVALVLGLAVLWPSGERRIIAGLSGVAAVLSVARLAIFPAATVPGLLIACPVLLVGVLAALRTRRIDVALGVTALGYAAAVLALQYAEGGGREWGGRFLALGLPVMLTIAVAALRSVPREIVVGLVVVTAAVSALGLVEVRRSHARNESFLAAVDVPAGAIPITTARAVPRLDWKRSGTRQWLLVGRDNVDELLDRLRAAGEARAFVVFPDSLPPTDVDLATKRVKGFEWSTAIVELRK